MNKFNISLAEFATSNWVQAKFRFQQGIPLIQKYNTFDKYFFFTEKDLPNEYLAKFEPYFNEYGFALYTWKPDIILLGLSQIDFGDYLFYMDGGCVLPTENAFNFKNKIIDLVDEIEHAVFPFSVGHWYHDGECEDIRIIRKQVLEKFNLENDNYFLHQFPHYEGGHLLMKKTQEVIDFIEEWKRILYDDFETTIYAPFFDKTGQFPQFLHNGVDQGILQILLYTKKLNKFHSHKTFFYDFNMIQRIHG